MKPPRFLVDENLSVLLPGTAHRRNYAAIHVNHRGLNQAKDWEILRVIVEEEWVLVTNNAIEFRGRYRQFDLHPGGGQVLLNEFRPGERGEQPQALVAPMVVCGTRGIVWIRTKDPFGTGHDSAEKRSVLPKGMRNDET